MRSKRSWSLVAVIVAVLILPFVLWKGALAFYGGPQEATWAFVFYGMIFALVALPVGIIILIARGLSKRRATRTLVGHEKGPENETDA